MGELRLSCDSIPSDEELSPPVRQCLNQTRIVADRILHITSRRNSTTEREDPVASSRRGRRGRRVQSSGGIRRRRRTDASGYAPALHDEAGPSGHAPAPHDGAGPSGHAPAPHDGAGPSGYAPAPHDGAGPSGYAPAPYDGVGASGYAPSPYDGAGTSGYAPLNETDWFSDYCGVDPSYHYQQTPFTPDMPPFTQSYSDQVRTDLFLGYTQARPDVTVPSRPHYNVSPVAFLDHPEYRDRGQSSSTTSSSRRDLNLNITSSSQEMQDEEANQPQDNPIERRVQRSTRSRHPRNCGTGGNL